MGRLTYYGDVSGQVGAIAGPKGDPGTPGPIGLLYGEGAPDDSIGVDGQGYLDELSGTLYKKSGGSWSADLTLVGPAGDPGSVIPVIFTTGGPLPEEAVIGQIGLDTTTWDLYGKSVESWDFLGNIRGPEGDEGEDGASITGPQGLGFANVVTWQSGVAYPIVNNQRPVVTHEGETYTANANVPSRTSFTSGDWVKITQKGADGEANIPSNVALTDAANAFGKFEITGGLLSFTSFNFTQMPTLTVTAANEATYLGKEIGFSSNTNTDIFEIRIAGDVSKGFNMKIRREGTAKVRILPNNTNAVGHHEDIPQIDATHPAYIANQYGAVLIEVRYKANASSCDFFVDGRVSAS